MFDWLGNDSEIDLYIAICFADGWLHNLPCPRERIAHEQPPLTMHSAMHVFPHLTAQLLMSTICFSLEVFSLFFLIIVLISDGHLVPQQKANFPCNEEISYALN